MVKGFQILIVGMSSLKVDDIKIILSVHLLWASIVVKSLYAFSYLIFPYNHRNVAIIFFL